MKNKGFTLVELLVAISLLAILTVIAIPTLRAFQAGNDKKTYENYGKSIVTSAKLYNDSYSEDLFGNLENGCQKVTLTELINKKVAKDITLKDVTCNKPDKDSYVLVWKYKNEYAFDPVVHCENSKGTDQYEDNNESLAEACVTATGKPYITVNTVINEANNTKKKSVIITLNDDFGFTANQEIQYAFSTINNANGSGVTGYKTYKFNNSYIKRKNTTVKLSTNSITIPSESTGTYYLYVKPVKVQNIINESITNIHKFGPYRFDHQPPACPTIKAYKADGSEVAKNTAAGISKFKITYSADDLQNYELQISYDNGSSWSTATTYGKDKVEYTPTKDGKIIIKTRAKDYANNQSAWCTSNTFIRDTTPPSAPTVTGYKKTNSRDISSKGSLATHASNTWLKGWIFTQASGSNDTNGVSYYCTTTGATSNITNRNVSYRNINAEGESTVKFRACDSAGNCSGWVSYIAKLDRTAPSCGTATGASKTWTKSNRTIKQACSETSGSGCAKDSFDKTFSSGTTKTSSDKIKDKVGNEKTCNYDVYVDKDAPTCGTATGASKTWTKSNRTIKQACSDTGSSCEKNSYDATYNSGTTKTKTITIKDKVGNSNTCTYNVYVDKEGPSAPTVTGYKKVSSANVSSESGLSSYTFNEWHNGWVLTKASGSTDSGSGVEGYYLTTSGQGTSDVTDSNQVYRNVGTQGTVTIKYRAKDKAGNWSSYTTKYVKLDRCGSTSTTWGNWSACSVVCDTGTRSRTGQKYSTISGHTSYSCGTASESETCNTGKKCEEWPYSNDSGGVFKTLQAAINDTPTGGTIILNLTTYNDNAGATLDANKVLSYKSPGKTLNLTNNHIVVKKGTLNIIDGTIKTSSDKRNAISVKGGTVNIKGGTIFTPHETDVAEETEAIELDGSGAVVNMTNGTVKSGTGSGSGYARAVNITSNGGRFNMSGGHVISNATKPGTWGGTGINTYGGKVVISGGTVEVIKGGVDRCLLCSNGGPIIVKATSSKKATMKFGGVVRNGGYIYWAEHSGAYVCVERGTKEELNTAGIISKFGGTKTAEYKNNGECS